ncbi:hypothetical protein QL285_071607 [Trifolium repens]|nr:hypothetical protein QL285_071607 [Trifolium repens]
MFNYQTLIYDYFTIPHEVLCNYYIHSIIDGYDHITRFLCDTFFLVPTVISNKVLCQMDECARRMVAHNTEGSGVFKMNVLLRVVTTLEAHFDSSSYYHEQNVGFPMKLSVKSISSNFTGQYSICFEEFRNGSHSELFHRKCSHIFHKNCIAKWICVSDSFRWGFGCKVVGGDGDDVAASSGGVGAAAFGVEWWGLGQGWCGRR